MRGKQPVVGKVSAISEPKSLPICLSRVVEHKAQGMDTFLLALSFHFE
jgi:hypothetical protein